MRTSIRSALFLVTCPLVVSCGLPSSSVNDFQRATIIKTEITPFQLSRAAPFAHKVLRKQVASGKYFFDSDFYDAEFPNLSEADFNALKTRYSSWSSAQSAVRYAANRTWTLSNFLPPAMQATLEQVFVPEVRTRNLPKVFGPNATGARESTSVTLLSNCWGTAYEIVRAARSGENSLALFYAPQQLARNAFLNPKWSEEIRPFSKEDFANAQERNKGLRTGDVLLVGDKWLQHVAIFIDNDFYFEKAGAGETALYRITHWNLLQQTWPSNLHGYSWRRFNKQTLPNPSELFNLRSSFPAEISTSLFSEDEIANLTVEVNREDVTGRVLGATWLERRNVILETNAIGEARIPSGM